MKTNEFTEMTLEELREKQTGERFKPTKADPQTPEAAEYLKNLKQPDKPSKGEANIMNRAFSLITRPQKRIEQVMSYEEARKIVNYITKERLAQLNKEPVFGDADKAIYPGVIKYFIGDPTAAIGEDRLDLHKGLFLFGRPGTGKSFLIETMRVFCNAAEIENRKFKMAVCHNIFDDVQASGDVQMMNKYFDGPYCFDDLGDEPNLLKSYGNELFVMQRILTERYRRSVNGARQTHVTSNLIESEIEAHYGSRVFDRCKEMFNLIHYGGDSKRL